MKKTINLLLVATGTLMLVSCVTTGNDKQRETTVAKNDTCETHEALANRASNFGVNNFYKSYAIKNDFEGARAQLFLIEEGIKGNPIGSFAKNYNAAEQSYNKSLIEAKEMGCNVSKYPISPISAFRKGVKILKSKSK